MTGFPIRGLCGGSTYMTGKSVTQVQGIFHKFYVTIDILANGSPKSSFSPNIYLRGEKDERDRINREARQLASNAFNKYKAESLAFLGK